MAYEIKGPRSRFTISFVQRKIYKNNGCFSPPLSTCNMKDIKVFIKTNQVYFAKKLTRDWGSDHAKALIFNNKHCIFKRFSAPGEMRPS
jgi:hypothetical protein